MSVNDDPTALFEPEPETESIPHSLDDDGSSIQSGKDTNPVCPIQSDKPDIHDENTLTFDTRDNDSEKMDVIPTSTNVVNSSDFQKVMDSIGEPLHDALDFVSNLDDHPSSQSLDEKLLDAVVEHETPEETMQVEQLMESIHNEKSNIGGQLHDNRGETLTFHKMDNNGQITERKVLDENDLKNNKELRLDNGNVTLTSDDNTIILSSSASNIQTSSVNDNIKSTTDSDKCIDEEMTPESYLQQVTGIVSVENQDVPIYDTVENKNDPKVFEAKDCLQKAMEAIDAPINDESVTDVSTVEDVLSALHSEVVKSESKNAIKTEDNADPKMDIKQSNSKQLTATSSGKRVIKDLKEQDSPQCFVTGCDSGKTGTDEVKRFFKPPPNPLIFKRWARNLCQGSQLLSFNSMICENHFRPGDIREVFVNGKKKWVLNEGALPKINSNKSTFQNFVTKKKNEEKKGGVGRGSGIYRTQTVEETADSDKKATAELLSTLADDMDTENVDPTILSYHPNLVKNAQEEITSLDVLVCGLCHAVFHFFEEFQDHKMNVNCRGTSTFKASLSEPKPQVWAFLLWKNAQTKIIGDMESSWKLYQRWCKMPENLRETWVAAGKALQDAHTLGHIKITDVPNKVGRPKTVTEPADMEDEDELLDMDVDTGGGGGGDSIKGHKKTGNKVSLKEERSSKVDGSGDISDKIEIKEEVISDYEDEGINEIRDLERDLERCRSEGGIINEEDKENEVENSTKRRGRPPKSSSLQMRQPGQPSKPLQEGQIQEEFVVEKIVSRRFNQKKKQYEYLLKWEGYPPEQNTWEPEENMSTCKHLLKEFEVNLAKQQAIKSGSGITKSTSSVLGQKKSDINQPGTSNIIPATTPGGRPVRSSKQKALDQVKVWCGSMIKTPDSDLIGKRRSSDMDSDDDEDLIMSKRIKLEQESDDSDSEVSRRPAKRFVGGRGGKQDSKRGRPPMNGIKKESNLAAALGLESSGEESPERSPSTLSKPIIRNMSSLSPQNQQVLVASAKGVVKVDPTQVPNLTSGVYIMSNKSGIVKLDTVTPSSALSSLQKKGVLKAAPGKGGVIMLDSSKPGSIAQKSGIIRKVQAVTSNMSTPAAQSSSTDTSVSTTGSSALSTSITIQATPKSTLPKGAFTSSVTQKQLSSSSTPLAPRPSGTLRPLRPGVSPRPVGLLRPTSAPRLSSLTPASGLQAKITTSIRPRVPSSVPNRQRAPLGNLIKSGIKPIESILGASSNQSSSQKLLLAKKKLTGLSECDQLKDEDSTTSGIVKINPVKKVLGGNLRGRGRGGVGRGGIGRGGRGSLASLVGMTMDDEDKLSKEEEDVFLDVQDQQASSDTDDGIPDDFPIGDLPPIEPDSPPRPLTLCPLTGKVLLKAEGEKTPEPTPPASPSSENKERTLMHDQEESTHSENSSSLIKVELESENRSSNDLSVDSATSSAVNNINSNTITITDPSSSSVTIKRGSNNTNASRGTRGSSVISNSHLSVLTGATTTGSTGNVNNNASSTSLGTITVPARKLYHQTTPTAVATVTTTSGTAVTSNETTEAHDVVTITGEDGLLYQVSNADVGGNTLLVSSSEGGQQCVYVTTEAGSEGVEGEESSTSAVLTLDSAYADAVAQLIPEQVDILTGSTGCSQFYVKEGDGGELVSLEEGSEDATVVAGSDDQAGQVVAQLVEAGEPAPGGGPRRVVLLLPDGNLMMTEVDEEQYAALELDK
ncbi:chromodomain-containing protein chromator isoform X3 [Lycorma delicatula]|uniref:chromodomain-containing protein chromator isoform X3 n=1 Tax=Lycorma delicatula TaxID=130591 RepID=UPI003F514CFD